LGKNTVAPKVARPIMVKDHSQLYTVKPVLKDSSTSPPELPDLTELNAARYTPLELLGVGGMGMVYKAQDQGLNSEPVALKLLNKNLIPDPSYAARFRREVAVARRLSHPNIVKIFDFGELRSGGYFFTMELIEGPDLRTLINTHGSSLPVIQALTIFLEVALALEYAHKGGIIHRDIKPENILLTKESMHAKLSDFSSAKEILLDLGLTPEGHVLGTPHYMAPELMTGAKGTPHTDMYSLGILLFEILSGEAPFDGDSMGSIFAKHMSEPIPLLKKHRDDVPEWCQEIIDTCTEKDPRDRYQSMGELIYEFLEYAIESDIVLSVPSIPPQVFALASEGRKKRRGLFHRFFRDAKR
jgi:serine/threonine-protein kinase